ncbi:MAG TPA: hypothetical protein VFI65_02135 [Streptosporangiaceae bacterium]|nr:hypothetical protein [Streptosporangiaceae bacterium]
MTMRKCRGKHTVAGLLCAATLALTASACGTSGPGLGSSGAAPADSHMINVCALVPSSRIASATGRRVAHATAAHPDSWPDPDNFTCTYSLTTGTEVVILVQATNSKVIFGANESNLTGGGDYKVTSLPGLGDKAGASAAGLAVLTDHYNVLIDTSYPGQFAGNPAGIIGLARNLVSDLESIPVKAGDS